MASFKEWLNQIQKSLAGYRKSLRSNSIYRTRSLEDNTEHSTSLRMLMAVKTCNRQTCSTPESIMVSLTLCQLQWVLDLSPSSSPTSHRNYKWMESNWDRWPCRFHQASSLRYWGERGCSTREYRMTLRATTYTFTIRDRERTTCTPLFDSVYNFKLTLLMTE